MTDPPSLTRARCKLDPTFWLVKYGDVPVGRYGPCNGIRASIFWAWSCGFYPGMDVKELVNGKADTEEEARAALLAAWVVMRPTLTEEQFEDWRRYARSQGWILAMRKAGLRLPTMHPDLRAACFCGAQITADDTDQHINEAHRELRP